MQTHATVPTFHLAAVASEFFVTSETHGYRSKRLVPDPSVVFCRGWRSSP